MRLAFTFLIMVSLPSLATTATLEDSLEFLKKMSPYTFAPDSTVDVFKTTNRISVLSDKITDDDFAYLVPLCQFQNIQILDFRFNRLTGAGLKKIADACGAWPSITYIDLGGNPLVDEHLVNLNAFPALEAVNLDFHDENGTSLVTGAFLKSLRLPQLENIWAVGTSLVDENVRVLMDLPNFESFNFRRSTLSESFLQELGAVKINLAVKKWDLRRITYESKQARPCMSEDDQKIQDQLLQLAVEQGLFDEAAAAYAKANGLVPLIMEGQEMSYSLYWVCKIKGHDEL